MPVEFSSVVFLAVELFHLRNEVLQLREGGTERNGHTPPGCHSTSVGRETGTRSELLDHAPAFRTFRFTISKEKHKTQISYRYGNVVHYGENSSLATLPATADPLVLSLNDWLRSSLTLMS